MTLPRRPFCRMAVLALMMSAPFAARAAEEPTDRHRILDPLIGKWTHRTTRWAGPGERPVISTGTADNTWILGGRFIRREVRGNRGGRPYEGIGYFGYDDERRQFQMVWIHNRANRITTGAGSYDPDTRTISLADPEHGFRSFWTINSFDTHTCTRWEKDAGGREFKAMESIYRRGL